jgi:hypothetical protein
MFSEKIIIKINWGRVSCNTCNRCIVHKRSPEAKGCELSKECDMNFSMHSPHPQFRKKVAA